MGGTLLHYGSVGHQFRGQDSESSTRQQSGNVGVLGHTARRIGGPISDTSPRLGYFFLTPRQTQLATPIAVTDSECQ